MVNGMSTTTRGERLFRNTARAWVGEPCTQHDATQVAEVPAEDDSRWQHGTPTLLDQKVLTLSPFFPSGRLGACVEEKKSNPMLSRYPNHPPFAGVVAWRSLEALNWTPLH